MSDIESTLTTIYTKYYPQDNNEETQSLFQSISTSYQNKLWYQLTLQLQKLIQVNPQLSRDLYEQFILISTLDKLSPLVIIDFLIFTQNDSFNSNLTDLKFLADQFQTKINSTKDNEPKRNVINYNYAILVINLEIAKNQLYLNNLIEGKDYLNQFESTYINNKNHEGKIEAPLFIINKFYQVNAIYFELKRDFNAFYTTTLLYLSTLDNNEILPGDSQIPFKMCVAAIKGDCIFNFGELLQHPILKEFLLNPPNDKLKYVVEILHTLSQGDFNKFNELTTTENTQDKGLDLDTETLLFLKQKICIMTLIELIFIENLRILSFTQIAEATRLTDNIGDVEHLVMKAISLGLLKGSIDQVNQLVTITWVQPRIINLDQVAKMNQKLIHWDEDVKQLAQRMDQYGESIWV
ncbi:26S proteasome regulatory subunit Rpn9p [Monosporozyma unispora]|nr:26S proteasome regulatory subunit [Kazachstania unispora]